MWIMLGILKQYKQSNQQMQLQQENFKASQNKILLIVSLNVLGCNVSLMATAYDYVIAHQGGQFCLENEHKYTTADGTCQFAKYSHVGSISKYVNDIECDEDDLNIHMLLMELTNLLNIHMLDQSLNMSTPSNVMKMISLQRLNKMAQFQLQMMLQIGHSNFTHKVSMTNILALHTTSIMALAASVLALKMEQNIGMIWKDSKMDSKCECACKSCQGLLVTIKLIIFYFDKFILFFRSPVFGHF